MFLRGLGQGMMPLLLCPANPFVHAHHRRHGAVQGIRFSLIVTRDDDHDDGQVAGAVPDR